MREDNLNLALTTKQETIRHLRGRRKFDLDANNETGENFSVVSAKKSDIGANNETEQNYALVSAKKKLILR